MVGGVTWLALGGSRWPRRRAATLARRQARISHGEQAGAPAGAERHTAAGRAEEEAGGEGQDAEPVVPADRSGRGEVIDDRRKCRRQQGLTQGEYDHGGGEGDLGRHAAAEVTSDDHHGPGNRPGQGGQSRPGGTSAASQPPQGEQRGDRHGQHVGREGQAETVRADTTRPCRVPGEAGLELAEAHGHDERGERPHPHKRPVLENLPEAGPLRLVRARSARLLSAVLLRRPAVCRSAALARGERPARTRPRGTRRRRRDRRRRRWRDERR